MVSLLQQQYTLQLTLQSVLLISWNFIDTNLLLAILPMELKFMCIAHVCWVQLMKAFILPMSILSALGIILNDVDYIQTTEPAFWWRNYVIFHALCFSVVLFTFLSFFCLLYSQGNYQYKVGTTVIIEESVKILDDTRAEVPQPMEQEVMSGVIWKWNDFDSLLKMNVK